MKRIVALLLALCLCLGMGSAMAATSFLGATETTEETAAAYPTTQAFLDVLDAGGLKYTLKGVDEDGDEHVVVNNTTDSLSYNIHYFFNAKGTETLIRIWNVIDYAAANRPAMIELVNQFNYDYKYAKFYADDSDNSLTVALDLYYRSADMLGDIVMEATLDLVNIIDACTVYLLPYMQ